MEKTPYRVRKAMDFHRGVTRASLFKLLEPYGFTREARKDGWTRVQLVAYLRKKAVVRLNKDPGIAARIEDYQSIWFRVARAALNASFPELSPVFFEGLVQRKGVEAALSLTTFVARIRELEGESPLFGEEGKNARELLAKHGLTDAVVETAEELLEGWDETIDDDAVAPAATDELKQAIEAAWDWYVLWSTIARGVITRPSELRRLGLGRRREGKGRRDEAGQGAAAALPSGAPGGIVLQMGPGQGAIAAE